MTKHLLISAAAAALIASGGFAAAQSAGDHAGRMDNGQGATHASEAGAGHQGAMQNNPSTERAQTRASNGSESGRGDNARSAQRDPSASQSDRAGQLQARGTHNGRDGDKKAEMNRDGAGKSDKDSTKSAQNRNSHDAKTGRSAAEDRASNPDRNGTTRDRADRTGDERTGTDRDRASASREGRDGRDTRVSSSDRARISETIRSQHVENIRNVDFDVRVGGVVPGRYRFNPLPTTIVSILPQYRGYDYLVANDEIIIVEPRTHRIVYTMSEGRSAAIDRPSTSCR